MNEMNEFHLSPEEIELINGRVDGSIREVWICNGKGMHAGLLGVYIGMVWTNHLLKNSPYQAELYFTTNQDVSNPFFHHSVLNGNKFNDAYYFEKVSQAKRFIRFHMKVDGRVKWLHSFEKIKD